MGFDSWTVSVYYYERLYTIGRSLDNKIVIQPNDKSISSHHALIYIDLKSKVYIMDLSFNGIFINNRKIKEKKILIEIQRGDKINLAKNKGELIVL